MRVKITLAYDGSRYLGFQVQKSTKQTVAQELYDALESLNIFTTLTSSGRTDKNVHASHQVIHLDLPSFWTDTTKLLELLNHKLPLTIRIKTIRKVTPEFHARFSPLRRSYRYLLTSEPINAFDSSYITPVAVIDKTKIDKALKLFLGEHDFKYFQKSGGGNGTSIRTIHQAMIYSHKNIWVIKITANGFLRSQIRMIVFALLAFMQKKVTLEQLQEQIDVKKQHIHGLAPASGLYLSHILYPSL